MSRIPSSSFLALSIMFLVVVPGSADPNLSEAENIAKGTQLYKNGEYQKAWDLYYKDIQNTANPTWKDWLRKYVQQFNIVVGGTSPVQTSLNPSSSKGRAVHISGSVMDGSAGKVLEGATVRLQSGKYSTTTNSRGDYSLKAVSPKTVKNDRLIVSKNGYGSVTRSIASYKGTETFVLTQANKVTFTASVADAKGTWQIARTVYDPMTKTSKVTWLTDSTVWNFKPNYSPDGKKITFFRRHINPGPDVNTWKTAICVMNADGSDFHELIDGRKTMNTEPYWTRDGSMRVTWNRMIVDSSDRLTAIYIMWSDWNGRPGKEKRIGGSAKWDWVNPHLKDGRMLVKHNGDNYYLLTPNSAGGEAAYKKVSYPDKPHNLHKLSISQDETMIAYQKHVDLKHDSYKGGAMVYADFDASIPAITNEVVFDALNPATQAWYVSITTDNKFLVFAKDGNVMQHDVDAGTTMQVTSNEPWRHHAYPTYVTYSK